MIFPLIIFALGLGVVAAYEGSSKTHAWVDEHVQALKDAVAAHQAAEVHLDAAMQAVPSPGGVSAPAAQQQLAQDHTATAQIATGMTAHKTAQMAQTAQTPVQRAAAGWMAALTFAMQEQIKMFVALQVAKNPQERDVAQKLFDAAVNRIRDVKIELSKLGVRV